MTRNEILKSDQAKQLFIRDSGIPMPVFEGHHFQMRISELEQLLGSVTSFLQFCNIMKRMNTEIEYDLYRTRLIMELRNSFSPIFKRLDDMDFHDLVSYEDVCIRSDALYEDNNDGHMFLRIGLVDNNISLLHYIMPDDCPDRIDKITDEEIPEFLKHSKAFNNSVFHDIRIRLWQLTYIMFRNLLHDMKEVPSVKCACVQDDALVFESLNIEFDMNAINKVLEKYAGLFYTEVFYLHSVNGFGVDGFPGWQEEIITGGTGTRFVKIDPNLYHLLAIYHAHDFVFKDDAVIKYNGKLARLLTLPENPFT